MVPKQIFDCPTSLYQNFDVRGIRQCLYLLFEINVKSDYRIPLFTSIVLIALFVLYRRTRTSIVFFVLIPFLCS